MFNFYKRDIDKFEEDIRNTNTTSVTDALVLKFKNDVMSDEEQKLINLAFKNNPKQEDLNELLKVWDIEVKDANKSLLLAYLMKLHPELKFTDYEQPRLKGLLQNFRFKNMKTISHFVKIVGLLNKNNIVPVIFKGGLMKHLRPELPRIMGDIDIIVPEKDFFKSAKLTETLGYWYDKIEVHSIDLHEKDAGKESYGVLDLHRFFHVETGKDKKWLKGLFKRAKEENVFGVKALVPCYEDILFITLINLVRNLKNNTSKAGILFTLFDCKFLIENKPDFDWKIIKDNAVKTKSEFKINFAIEFISSISDDIIPEKIKQKFLFKKEMENFSNTILYDRFYLKTLRDTSRNMKFFEVLKKPNLYKKYICVKIKYIVLKNLRNRPLLIKLLIRDLKKATKEV